MRRLAAFAVVVAGVLGALAAAAQHPTMEAPDVPAGPATLRGRVVNDTHPDRVGGIEAVLYALTAQGVPGVRRTTTDPEGRFVFEKISNDPGTTYLVGVTYRGVSFPGSHVRFSAGQTTQEVEVHVADPTEDASHVRLEESVLQLEWIGAKLRVTERHRVANSGPRPVYVAKTRRGSVPPPLRFALPKGASELAFPGGIVPEGVELRENEIRFYGPIHRTTQELSFAYTIRLPGERQSIRKPFPSRPERVVVRVPEGSPALESPQLAKPKSVELDGRTWTERTASLRRDGTLALAVERPPLRTDVEAVEVSEARVILELDDAAVRAQEEVRLHVDGDASVVAPEGKTLLHVSLPEGAEDVRFARDSLRFGLVPADAGGIDVSGPVPPGDSEVAFTYRVPLSGPSARLTRQFSRRVPVFSLFVADDGILVRSERLHRRRPVRTADRIYAHYEGFQLKPGEAVTIEVGPLPPPRRLPRWAVVAVVAAVGGLAAFFLASPLRSSAALGRIEALEAPEAEVQRERETVYAALRDLEHDFETEKISEEDYRALRAELRRRAAELLRLEREAERATAPQPPEAAPTCGSCGTPSRPGDRFCAQCGSPLAAVRAGDPGA